MKIFWVAKFVCVSGKNVVDQFEERKEGVLKGDKEGERRVFGGGGEMFFLH